MVLQSFLQYRQFNDSPHVKAYADVHPSLSRLTNLQSEKKAQLEAANIDQDPQSTTTSDTSPSAEQDQDQARQQDQEDRELPGNIVGERVELGLREKARGTPAVDQEDPFLVKFDDEEEANPQNWTWFKKWTLVFLVTSIGLLVGAAASINSAGSKQAAARFGVSTEVMELQTAVFLIGFGVSAPFLGALSEIGGRNPVYAITLLCFSLFEIGSALAPNIQTRVIMRFFAGLFGSTPLSNAGGSIADITDARARTFVFPIFANAGFLGPAIGPIIGGYLAMNVGQEWCDWLTAIWGFATLIVVVLFMPETYAPVILKMKASHVRQATGDERYKSALEKERERVPFKQHFKHVLALPFLYLIYEPIVLLLSAYISVIYIVFFGDFEAYPIIFEPFGFNTGEIGLSFIPVAVGLCLTTLFVPLWYKRYLRIEREIREKKRQDGDKNWEKASPPPEERLTIAMWGTFLIPIALFYQAWTSYPTLPPWPCLSAGFLFGAGILTVFISTYMYIIDVYKAGSATALGSLTFMRYIVSGGAVMFTPPMYHRLTAKWALTLLALLSAVFCTIPFFFYRYGHQIRQWSRYVPAED